MGYFDALTSSSFKTTDGHRLFFPWGVLGRGYIIGSEPEYKQLRLRVKTFTIIGVVSLIAGAVAGGIMAVAIGVPASRGYLAGPVVAAVLGVFYIAFYIAWLPHLLRGLQPSHERLTLRESMTNQAREHRPMVLWAMEVVSVGFVGGSVFLLVSRPGIWPTAVAGIVFFGLGAILFARMLIMRWRA